MTKLEQIARLIDPEAWSQYDMLLRHVSAQGADRGLLDEAAQAMLTPSRDKAKAMLALLREPTEAMISAGYIRLEGETFDRPREPMNAWPAMIDAILQETDEAR